MQLIKQNLKKKEFLNVIGLKFFAFFFFNNLDRVLLRTYQEYYV